MRFNLPFLLWLAAFVAVAAFSGQCWYDARPDKAGDARYIFDSVGWGVTVAAQACIVFPAIFGSLWLAWRRRKP